MRFESHRSQLRAVAYRMLGSATEEDEAVQEAWFRLSRSDTSEVGNLAGWLTTVVGRVCLDMLRPRKSRAEQPLGTWTPADSRAQPPSSSGTADPERDALLADSVGAALIVVLDTLTPAERLAFVLHDLFGVPFEEVARIVDRTPASARQLASRARRRIRGAPARGAGADRRREWSAPSWPPRGTATSMPWSPYWTRMWSRVRRPASPPVPRRGLQARGVSRVSRSWRGRCWSAGRSVSPCTRGPGVRAAAAWSES
ncbi:RNA polymerase sigma factor (sigma-70 family) [Streptomyces turgidiscabies]|uniref:RNA polymerase sigma factor (Sigma-70 family) n=1 Tax=Streptomyces turgidiscabies TaxID=85558 RepID=A0ABU0RR66_9ACTN|nr:RNA polymerase sigma factor (sigma-70 family) [Streptomyces turgidiscabies]